MLSKAGIALLLILISADLSVERSDSNFNIKFDISKDRLLEKRVKEGLTVKYKFLIQLCRHRGAWFDYCEEEKKEIHEIKFDAVSENYKIIIDRFYDGEPPRTESFETYDEAIKALSSIQDLPVDYLVKNRDSIKRSLESKRSYLSTRLIVTCQEHSRDTLDWLSYLFTIGVVDSSVYDTGWVGNYINS